MSLDVSSLKKVKRRGDTITAQCPACAEAGHDRTGNHLTIFASGKWSCVVYPGNREHNHRIWELCGGAEPNLRNPKVEKPHRSSPSLMNIHRLWLNDGIGDCAEKLGVSAESLLALDVRWAPPHRAWAFPMRDGEGNVIGIRLRAEDGRKWAVQGSRNGIFMPVQGYPIRALVTEGPTDTAAALTLGFFAVGRPACNCGGDLIKTALTRLNIHRAIIVADRDTPGQQGAQKLAKQIGVRSTIWTPPAKDLREFLQAGGTRDVIDSEVSNFVWKKP